MNKKQSLRFLLGYTAITFNELGLVMTGILSPNPFVWWFVSPLIIFTTITSVQMLISWSDKGDIGMSKYVIKNCPVNYGLYKEMCGFVKEPEDVSKKCADCTDCVLKQIVELCRNIDCPCEYQGADCWECSRIGAKTFADKILKLLDIEECE